MFSDGVDDGPLTLSSSPPTPYQMSKVAESHLAFHTHFHHSHHHHPNSAPLPMSRCAECYFLRYSTPNPAPFPTWISYENAPLLSPSGQSKSPIFNYESRITSPLCYVKNPPILVKFNMSGFDHLWERNPDGGHYRVTKCSRKIE